MPTLVDVRTNLGREVIEELAEHFPDKVTQTFIGKRVKIAEAPSFGQSILVYAPDSEGAREFEALAEELAHRLDMAPASPVTNC